MNKKLSVMLNCLLMVVVLAFFVNCGGKKDTPAPVKKKAAKKKAVKKEAPKETKNEAEAGEPAEKIKVKVGEDTHFTFKESTPGEAWKAISRNLEVKIKKKGEAYIFKLDSERYKLKKSGPKYKLKTEDGTLVLKVKIATNPDKIKIYQTEDDPAPWSLKAKEDGKWKIKKGEELLGKIKFYMENGKVKVKDTSESEVCSAKAEKLLLAPAVCLFKGLDEKKQLFAFAILSLIDRTR